MLNSFDPDGGTPEPRKIGPGEAHAASRAGHGVLLDVRDARLFDNAHLDGAIALPMAEIDALDGRLPARIALPDDPLLILYCA